MSLQTTHDPVPQVELIVTCAASFIGCASGMIYFMLGGNFSTLERISVPTMGIASAVAIVALLLYGSRLFNRVAKFMLFLWGIGLVANIGIYQTKHTVAGYFDC